MKTARIFLTVLIFLGWVWMPIANCAEPNEPEVVELFDRAPSPRRTIDLKSIPYKLVYETYRQVGGRSNWEIYQINADGSHKRNLTRTPYVDEMYPHVSPDGTKISYVLDRGQGRRKTRSVYYMNSDGADQTLVARNARQPCWSPDGKTIAYLKGEYERYSTREYATAELMFYNLETGEHLQHVNKELHHLYAICWAPDPNWFLGVIHGALEYSDTILAFPTHGTEVYDLAKWGVKGCRPDLRFDGKQMVWGETDWELCVGDISFDGNEPMVTHVSTFAGCDRDSKVYHVDYSPDGKYVAFSYGPSKGGQQVGAKAKDWNICISDLSGHWVQITTDGNHNKEPDWMPIVSDANSIPSDEQP